MAETKKRRRRRRRTSMNGVGNAAASAAKYSTRGKKILGVAGGLLLGGVACSMINGVANPNNEAGAKAYLAPILVAGLGITGVMLSENEDIQNVAMGVAGNGTLQVVSAALKGKDAFRLSLKPKSAVAGILGSGMSNEEMDDIVKYLTEGNGTQGIEGGYEEGEEYEPGGDYNDYSQEEIRGIGAGRSSDMLDDIY